MVNKNGKKIVESAFFAGIQMQVQNNFGGNTAPQNLKITLPIVTERLLCNRSSEILYLHQILRENVSGLAYFPLGFPLDLSYKGVRAWQAFHL